jgi:hypothetical protein
MNAASDAGGVRHHGGAGERSRSSLAGSLDPPNDTILRVNARHAPAHDHSDASCSLTVNRSTDPARTRTW